MLFDPTPKVDRKDFFDREKEIEKLKRLETPIVLVLGLRRTGKSSLIKIVLNELKDYLSIYVDLRKYEEKNTITYRDFLLDLQNEINRLGKKYNKLIDALKNIKGVKILGNEVKFSWSKEERFSFSSLLDSLEQTGKSVIVLDEAQELVKMRGVNLLPSLAYAFDNLKNVKIIISGSEMGMVYDFLKVEDSSSPLYGRAFSTIELKPFDKETAIKFLKKGFEELNISFNKEEEVYETIGGIPGWLTYFGFTYYQTRNYEESVRKTLEYAKKLIYREFENFLKPRYIAKERYYTAMRTISNCASWSEIKRSLEAKEGIEISDSEIYNYLIQLLKHSWIVKEDDKYCPSEPLIGKTFKT
ncbi:ATP-binding protein [Sulfurisphaera javensis]|uniref:ATP-binding protein n=1 Tax=Sulfurisphaera javensis TaxID=2049879 RepID=A0AAT9GV18_9CREN